MEEASWPRFVLLEAVSFTAANGGTLCECLQVDVAQQQLERSLWLLNGEVGP